MSFEKSMTSRVTLRRNNWNNQDTHIIGLLKILFRDTFDTTILPRSNIPLTDANTTFGMAKRWITMKFTWLYIGSQDVWAIVIIIIYFSKYGNMKLG